MAEADSDLSVGPLDVADGEPGVRSGPLGLEKQQQPGGAVFGLGGVVVVRRAIACDRPVAVCPGKCFRVVTVDTHPQGIHHFETHPLLRKDSREDHWP
jgi:hypothetical protein